MTSLPLMANRPEPILPNENFKRFTKESSIDKTIESLVKGDHFIVEGLFSDGLDLLHGLEFYLQKKHNNYTFFEQRKYRAEFRRLAHLILLEVKDQELVVKKAPKIGWLEKLYPAGLNFYLSFSEIQGLNSAWQWFINGITIPGIRNKIHPYYGVYFPTRFEHLIVFDNWLKHYIGPKKTAIDVGIGCGVLSFLIIKHGFQKSFGTDLNPNAIIGLTESMAGTKLARMIEISHGHLFVEWHKKTELIVFNPPWLPLPTDYKLENLDTAMYYNEKLFEEFFEESEKRLLPDGRLILLFSNLGEIINAKNIHPIKKELKSGNRFVLDRLFTKVVKKASEKTKRDQHWRQTEEVEMWVLKLIVNV
jgi:methylase of polypeptide subunit release factors